MLLIEHLFERAEKLPQQVAFQFYKNGALESINLATLIEASSNLAKVLINKGASQKKVLFAVDEEEDYLIGLVAAMMANSSIVLFPYRRFMPHHQIKEVVNKTGATIILSRNKSGNIPNVVWIHAEKAAHFSLEEPLPVGEDGNTEICLYDHIKDEMNTFSLGQCIESCRILNKYLTNKELKQSGICWHPLYQHIGFFYGLLLPLCINSRMTLLHENELDVDPSIWLSLIDKYRINYCIADNKTCLRATSYVNPVQLSKLDLSSVEGLFLFDKPIQEEALNSFSEKFSKACFKTSSIFTAYDNLNSAFMLTAKHVDRPISKLYIDKYAINSGIIKPIAMDSPNALLLYGRGNALEGCDIEIVDLKTTTPVGNMQIGEVCFKGRSIAKDPSRKHAEDGFIHSGDIGFKDERGELYLFGKVCDRITIGAHTFNKYAFFRDLVKENPSLGMHQLCYIVASEEAEKHLIIALESELSPRATNAIFDSIITVMQHHFNIANVKIAVFNPGSIPRTLSNTFDATLLEKQWHNNELVPKALWEIDSNKLELMGERKALIHLQGLSDEKVAQIYGGWLRTWLALRLKTDEENIDFNKHLTGIGLDFQDCIDIARETDITFGQWFNPSYLWEFPNLKSLVHFLFNSSHQDEESLPELNALKASSTDVLSQQESYIYQKISESPDNYNYQALRYVNIIGSLNINRFEEALQHVTNRHGALRTCYQKNYDSPERYVSSTVTPDMRYVDVSDIEHHEERQAQLNQFLIDFEHEVFNVNSAPLWSILLIRISKAEFGLALKCHHLIADSWGISMLLEDIVRVYDCLHQDKKLPSIQTIYQYDDYASWQAYCEEKNLLGNEYQYWQQRLKNLQALNFPFPDSEPSSDDGALCFHFNVDAKLVRALQELSKYNNSSLYTLHITAFQLLLSWFCHQEKVAFKAKHFNRQRQHNVDIIGNFESGFIIQEELYSKMLTQDLLTINQDMLSRHYRHMDISFQAILKAIPDALSSSMPNAEFTFHRHPTLNKLGDAVIQNTYDKFTYNLMPDKKTHLILHHFETEDGMHCFFQCRESLFTFFMLQELSDKYLELLETLIHNAALPIADVIGEYYQTPQTVIE